MRATVVATVVGTALVVAAGLLSAASGPGRAARAPGAAGLRAVQRFVIIYQENHSFDNLFGSWEGVDGLSRAPVARRRQVDQDGRPLRCLPQADPSLVTPPLTKVCSGVDAGGKPYSSHFPNRPFDIFKYIKPAAKTCAGQPGGCTMDPIHNVYQARFMVNHGRMNRFALASNAVGLTIGHYRTQRLPIYRYLHARDHPRYAIADRFFAAAFGGSMLNHIWLVAARMLVWPHADNSGGPDDLHSVVDANGMPRTYPHTPLYMSPLGNRVSDNSLTASCRPPAGRPPTPRGVVCGNYVVNTTSPLFQPHIPGTPTDELVPPQTAPTIGGRLSARRISWAWYSQGWSNADGRVGRPGWTNGTQAGPGGSCPAPGTMTGAKWPNCPSTYFVDHHQPFNYFAAFSPKTEAGRAQRTHLRDLVEFQQALRASRAGACRLPRVSFVKFSSVNEHPGNHQNKYRGEYAGNQAVVSLLRQIERARSCTRSAMIIYTYDEFGGSWDHVPPPGYGTRGPHDRFGPGVRIPAVIISPLLRGRFVVDHVEHDTTSIAATLEHRFGLRPLTSRDRAAHDLSSVLRAPPRRSR
jgi:acid phosphatase